MPRKGDDNRPQNILMDVIKELEAWLSHQFQATRGQQESQTADVLKRVKQLRKRMRYGANILDKPLKF